MVQHLVIELKTGEFEPEHIGQLGFYMTAVDRQIKKEKLVVAARRGRETAALMRKAILKEAFE